MVACHELTAAHASSLEPPGYLGIIFSGDFDTQEFAGFHPGATLGSVALGIHYDASLKGDYFTFEVYGEDQNGQTIILDSPADVVPQQEFSFTRTNLHNIEAKGSGANGGFDVSVDGLNIDVHGVASASFGSLDGSFDYGGKKITFNVTSSDPGVTFETVMPLPSSAPMFGIALLGLGGAAYARRRLSSAQS